MKKLRSRVPYWGMPLLSLWLLSGGVVFASQNQAQAKAKMSKVLQAYNQGDYDTALELLEKARQLDPTLPQLKPLYGASLYAEYCPSGEEHYARKALTVFKQIYDREH